MHRCPVAKERFPVAEANKKMRKKTKKKEQKYPTGKDPDVKMETVD